MCLPMFCAHKLSLGNENITRFYPPFWASQTYLIYEYYRVSHVLVDLGWVDLKFKSTQRGHGTPCTLVKT